MDTIAIDCTDIDGRVLRKNRDYLLLAIGLNCGEKLSASVKWQKLPAVFPYQLLTSVSQRVTRIVS